MTRMEPILEADHCLEIKKHKTTYSQEIGLIDFDVFSVRENPLLTLTEIKETSNICYHHKQLYLIRYASHKENMQIHSNYTRNYIKV